MLHSLVNVGRYARPHSNQFRREFVAVTLQAEIYFQHWVGLQMRRCQIRSLVLPHCPRRRYVAIKDHVIEFWVGRHKTDDAHSGRKLAIHLLLQFHAMAKKMRIKGNNAFS